jgi:hypothetical protein
LHIYFLGFITQYLKLKWEILSDKKNHNKESTPGVVKEGKIQYGTSKITCPYCGEEIKSDTEISLCPYCKTPISTAKSNES